MMGTSGSQDIVMDNEGLKLGQQPGVTGSAHSPPLAAQIAPGAFLALGLLLGINLFNYIDRQVLSANMGPIKEHFQVRSDGLMGLLNTAFMVAYMIFAPLFGWLADRVSRWWLLAIGVVVWSLASGASGLSNQLVGMTGFWVLFGTRCFVGIGEAAYGPVAPALLSDLFPVRSRGLVLSCFNAAIPVGSALGYTLGGLLAGKDGVNWPTAFYWVVPPGILLGLLCFFMREPKRGQTDLAAGHTARHVSLRDYRKLFHNPSYVLNTLGMTCLTFALGGIAVWMPYYLIEFRKLGSHEEVNTLFGLIVVVSGLVATILGGLAGDWLRKYFSGSYFLVSGIAMLLAFPLFVAVVYVPKEWLWSLIFFACFSLFFNTGPTNTILANVTHPSLRAPAFALNIFVIHALGDAISPTVIGFISDLHPIDLTRADGSTFQAGDLNLGFLAVSVMILLGAILWLIGTRFLGRDTERAVHQLDD